MMLTRKHVGRFGIALLAAVAIYFMHGGMQAALWEPAFVTGWILLGGMLILALLNTRKKLPFLPLAKVRNWVKLHVYLGWFVVGVFLIHIDFDIPNGWIETTMAVLFVVVALSGVIGAFLSKSLPPRLTRRGEEVIFERIPVFITQLREAADDLAVYSVEQTSSTSIADFYTEQLREWFMRPRDYFEHLMELGGRRFALKQDFDSMERYLNDTEKEVLGELRALAEKKSDLDYHHALQMTLKGWLFIHIPATYALLALAVVHVILVHAFTGMSL